MTLLIWFEINLPIFAILIILLIKPDLILRLRKKYDSDSVSSRLLSEDLYNEKGKKVLEEALYEYRIWIRIGVVIFLAVLIVANIVCIPRIVQDKKDVEDAWQVWVEPMNGVGEEWSTGILSGHSDAVEDITELDCELRQLDFSKENTCEHEAEYKIRFSNGNVYYVKAECGGVCIEKYGRMRQAQMTADIEELLVRFGVE